MSGNLNLKDAPCGAEAGARSAVSSWLRDISLLSFRQVARSRWIAGGQVDLTGAGIGVGWLNEGAGA